MTTLAGLFARSRALSRRQRLLRLRWKGPVDIVLGTSHTLSGQQYKYRRLLTSFGNLRAATAFSRAIGENRTRNALRISLSESGHVETAEDLVLLGGPRKSEMARLFLDYLCGAHPELGLSLGDNTPQPSWVKLAGQEVHYDDRNQAAHPDYPKTDYALVVAWANPFAQRRRRAFFCGGFTSYGTAAGTEYLLTDFLHHRAIWRRTIGWSGLLPWRWARSARTLLTWPCFVLLLEIHFNADRAIDVKELAFCSIAVPTPPLTARSSAWTNAPSA